MLQTTHGEWDQQPPTQVETDIVPLVDLDQSLDAQLVEQLSRAVREHLSADELSFFDQTDRRPHFDVVRLDGNRAMKVTFFGDQTWVDWDGTTTGAQEIVGGLAERVADWVSSYYWQTPQGWRSKTTFDGSE